MRLVIDFPGAVDPSFPSVTLTEDGEIHPVDVDQVNGDWSEDEVVVWDLRQLLLKSPKCSALHQAYALRTILGAKNIRQALREHAPDSPSRQEMEEFEDRIKACQRAMSLTKTEGNVSQGLPPDFGKEYSLARARALTALADVARGTDNWKEFDLRRRFVVALHEVEQNGIMLDTGLILRELKKIHPEHVSRFLRSASPGGLSFSFFNPIGGKTGRVKVEGGLNCMAIPHDPPCRQTLVSRFPGGKIWSFDFNAIDYRCIAAAVGGEFEQKYLGFRDFHARTAELVGTDRETAKKASYPRIYGGNLEGTDQELVERLDKLLAPVYDFRRYLWEVSLGDGYVSLPHGKKLPVPRDAHPGMLMGLYAQSFSSSVFEQAFWAAHTVLKTNSSNGSVVIFPVHDEVVADIHPDDVDLVPALVEAMQNGPAAVVRSQGGNNYAEATQ